MVEVKRIVWYAITAILISLILLILLEFAVRILNPQINFQGVQRSMFVENKFDQTLRLKPNSSGKFFGKEFNTDKHGFRQMNTPTQYDRSWLFLGDSVTFGVAIEKEKIFPQVIQNEFRHTRIWNTAVVGYSTLDYLNVVKAFIRDHSDLEKIILFLCLNDVYGNLSLNFRVSAKEKVLSFFRSNSKLYLFLKKIFFDRSKAYALHDIGLYKEGNPAIDEYLNAMVRIKSISDKLNIKFLVVVLPYEYQLRVGGLRTPQVLLKNFFARNDIKSLDLYEDFSSLDSEDYFLYGDAMHFSHLGHTIVARKMLEVLK